MIHIEDKAQCCGCNACGDACAHNAITFVTDNEGFWYPKVDENRCVDCGLCEQVCPMQKENKAPGGQFVSPVCIGAYHKDLLIRFQSTSGGLFTALASAVLRQGGYVSGAVYTDDFDVVSIVTNSKRNLKRLRSSKYVQSSADGLYAKIKSLLLSGEKVLACGTPCQMAALRSFLGKDYNNLVIVDFLCRAINSPKVFHKYLESLENKFDGKIVSIKDKNKDHGWRSLARKITFDNGMVYYGEGHDDNYRRGYHLNVFCRPSCYQCRFKGVPRIADITLGDFWGIEKVCPELDRDLGTSMVCLNNEKGKAFFECVKDKLEWREVSLDHILAGNRMPFLGGGLAYPAGMNRDELFNAIDKMPFDEVAQRFFPKMEWKKTVYKKQKLLNAWSLLKLHKWQWGWLWRNIRLNFFHSGVKSKMLELKFLEACSKYVALDIKGQIEVDGYVRIGKGRNSKSKAETAILVEQGAVLRFDGENRILPHSDIQVFPKAELRFGAGATNMGLKIVCSEKIWIGDHTHIGRDVWIRDNNGGHYVVQKGYSNSAPIHIGDYVWICSNVHIMKGVTIGDGAVVASNSVVTENVPPRVMVSGNPARVIAEDIVWRP